MIKSEVDNFFLYINKLRMNRNIYLLLEFF